METCSCGCTKPHVVAHRETADGYAVNVWSDGALTRPMGIFVRGLGSPRSSYDKRRRSRAIAMLRDDIGLFNITELPRIVRAIERGFAMNFISTEAHRAFVFRHFA